MRTWPALDVSRPAGQAGGTSPGTGADELPELFHAALIDYDISAVDESAPGSWRVFFGSPEARDRALPALQAQFPDLALHPLDVDDEDWAARSQAELRAVQVGRVTVAPPWDIPPPDTVRRSAPRITVVIQPSMGFGTGHHATTRQCLAMMQHFEIQGSTVLDVGTGSGVLAIAASLLGASFVVGIDDDPDATQSARENLALNPGAKVDFRVVDLRATVLFRFDLVVANLTGALLLQTAGRLQDLVAHRGPLILSGFLKEEEPSVLTAFPALRVVDRTEEDGWVCVTLQRPGAFE